MTPLTLFHLDYCPFCRRVRSAAQQLGIPLNLVDIEEVPEARRRLMQERGKATVPVLELPDGSLLGESLDIIDRLSELKRNGGV